MKIGKNWNCYESKKNPQSELCLYYFIARFFDYCGKLLSGNVKIHKEYLYTTRYNGLLHRADAI
jgi:hypothetical protein